MAAENVVYRGEGIQNLVLANQQERKVYRLRKIVNKKKTDDNEVSVSEEERSREIHNSQEDIVNFVKNVMEPLLSKDFVSVPEIAHIPKGFVERIEAEIECFRPAHRKINKNNFQTVDPATCSALVLPDLCFLRGDKQEDDVPTISVEIKPKKGFLPSVNSLPKTSHIKASVCKFCLHKKLKEQCGRWTTQSQYCPLDLFSGDRRRMKHALLAGFNTPQNNLKIFQNGQEVYGELVQQDISTTLHSLFGNNVNGLRNGLLKQQELHTFLDLVIDALLSSPIKGDHSAETANDNESQNESTTTSLGAEDSSQCSCAMRCHKQPSSRECTIQKCSGSDFDVSTDPEQDETPYLPEGCVLERILYTQKFDEGDVESVGPLFEKIRNHLQQHPEDGDKLSVYGPFTRDTWLLPCLQKPESEDTDSLDYAVHMVKRFLVSRTMQDCSIMVALKRLPQDTRDLEENWRCVTDRHGQKFICSVNIIDLDPKPFDKLQKYKDLEKKILQAFETAKLI